MAQTEPDKKTGPSGERTTKHGSVFVKSVMVSINTHGRLRELQSSLSMSEMRQVTYDEILNLLVDAYNTLVKRQGQKFDRTNNIGKVRIGDWFQ